MVMMQGKLNDPSHEKQRAIYLLKVVRAAIGRAILEDPDVDELEELERPFGSDLRWARRFEAHTADEALLALAHLATIYVKNPDHAVAPNQNAGSLIPRAHAERLARLLVAAAEEDDE